MITAEEMEPAGHVHVNAGRLWAGGVATALVAALAGPAGPAGPGSCCESAAAAASRR